MTPIPRSHLTNAEIGLAQQDEPRCSISPCAAVAVQNMLFAPLAVARGSDDDVATESGRSSYPVAGRETSPPKAIATC
jgi:hypothetical protein